MDFIMVGMRHTFRALPSSITSKDLKTAFKMVYFFIYRLNSLINVYFDISISMMLPFISSLCFGLCAREQVIISPMWLAQFVVSVQYTCGLDLLQDY